MAQAKELRSGTSFPLVPTQVQLWIRELRRLGRLVHEKPVFSWLDEPTQEFPSLPVFHCSECGESGWIALVDPGEDSRIGAKGVTGHQLLADPTRIYRGWFGVQGIARRQHRGAESLAGAGRADQGGRRIAEPGGTMPEVSQSIDVPTKQAMLLVEEWFLCPKSLVLRMNDGPCPLTGDPKRFRVKLNRECRQDDQQGARAGRSGMPELRVEGGGVFHRQPVGDALERGDRRALRIGAQQRPEASCLYGQRSRRLAPGGLLHGSHLSIHVPHGASARDRFGGTRGRAVDAKPASAFLAGGPSRVRAGLARSRKRWRR